MVIEILRPAGNESSIREPTRLLILRLGSGSAKGGFEQSPTIIVESLLGGGSSGDGSARLHSTFALQSPEGEYSALVAMLDSPAAFPLGLLTSAWQHLHQNGVLLVLCTSSSSMTHAQTSRARHDYLADIASRFGFTPRQTAPTRESALPLDFWVFEKTTVTQRRWRLAECAEHRALAGLFHRAFNASLSEELWRWKYSDGRGMSIVAFRRDVLVAHYGGVRRRARCFGDTMDTVQICDVMVDPLERAVMTKRGVMFLTSATFFELQLAVRHQGALAYGFPSRVHMRLGELTSLYGEADRMVELHWGSASPGPRMRTRVCVLKPDCNSHIDAALRLWTEMASDLADAILIARDLSYLRYRYMEHPEHDYDVLLVTQRFSRRALGIFVTRQHDDSVELLDIVAPLKNVVCLIDQARRLASRWGKPNLYCWITQSFARMLETADADRRDPDISVAIATWLNDVDLNRLRGRFWLMSGDTDFH